MRLIFDIGLWLAAASPVLWLIGVLRWRKLKRQAERFRTKGELP